MLDIGHIANAIKSAQPPPLQAQPSIPDEMKPVPQAETENAVPPPAKGGDPGLGEHLDLYDTEAGQNPVVKDPRVSADAAESPATPETAQPKLELLGDKTGLPQPSTEPIHPELPFLKPLGGDYLGHSLDARI